MTKSSNNSQQNSGTQQSSAKPERPVKVSGPKLVGGALDGGSKDWFDKLNSNKNSSQKSPRYLMVHSCLKFGTLSKVKSR